MARETISKVSDMVSHRPRFHNGCWSEVSFCCYLGFFTAAHKVVACFSPSGQNERHKFLYPNLQSDMSLLVTWTNCGTCGRILHKYINIGDHLRA